LEERIMNPGRCYGRAIAVFSSALALLVAAYSANGAVTVYTFSDTTLFNTAGSGTISGSFDFDPLAPFAITTFDVTTSTGTGAELPVFTGYDYTAADSTASYSTNGYYAGISFVRDDGTGALDFYVNAPLGTDPTYNVTNSSETLYTGGFAGSEEIVDYREGNTGTLTASQVPEPTAAASLVLALTGCVLRRGRRSAVPKADV
jgi:hypothetical protein